jgi:hypothetical protein
MPPKVEIKQLETGRLKFRQVTPTSALKLNGDGRSKGERNGESEAYCQRPMDLILVFQSKISQ